MLFKWQPRFCLLVIVVMFACMWIQKQFIDPRCGFHVPTRAMVDAEISGSLPELKVMTFNVLFYNWHCTENISFEGRCSKYLGQLCVIKSMKGIVKFVADHKPDVLAIQEGIYEANFPIDGYTKVATAKAQPLDPLECHLSNELWVADRILAPAGVRPYVTVETTPQPRPRGMPVRVAALADVKIGGRGYRFASVHLSGGRGVDTQVCSYVHAKKEEMSKVLDVMDWMTQFQEKKEPLPMIILGDFNGPVVLGQEEWDYARRLFQSDGRFRSTWETFKQLFSQYMTEVHTFLSSEPQGWSRAYDDLGQHSSIYKTTPDWVYYKNPSGANVVLQNPKAHMLPGSLKEWSDHGAIMVTFQQTTRCN